MEARSEALKELEVASVVSGEQGHGTAEMMVFQDEASVSGLTQATCGPSWAIICKQTLTEKPTSPCSFSLGANNNVMILTVILTIMKSFLNAQHGAQLFMHAIIIV